MNTKNRIQHKFKNVSHLWDFEVEKSFFGSDVDSLIYRSNLLGRDLRITNYGGGNTSVKTTEEDPFTGELAEVMWVKGSGGDLGTMKRNGLAGLYLNKLNALKKRYKGLAFEDEMVAFFSHCFFDIDSKAPSIDTPLHAFIPYKHIDHLHPDSIISIATAKDGEEITRELFEGKIAWIPWQRPGFDLALKIEKSIVENPGIEGIILASHGLFTWADTSYECYMRSLSIIERASEYIAGKQAKKPVFGGIKKNALEKDKRKKQAVSILPLLRKYCSTVNRKIAHFSDIPEVLEFIGSNHFDKLAPMGTSCPDHFLRTKINPLILDIDAGVEFNKGAQVEEVLEKAFQEYQKEYTAYYSQCKSKNTPALRDPNPVIILWPGVGLFSFAKDKSTARIASEFYINAINVMRGAEAISSYTSLPMQEAFNIEYWELEEAKLKRMPKPKSLSGKIAIVTGGSGGIGKAITRKLLEEGACIVATDLKNDELQNLKKELDVEYGKDNPSIYPSDASNASSLQHLIDETVLEFGGMDILVNCAGLAISKSIEETTLKDWDLLQDVMVKGQFILSKEAAGVMQKQKLGGDIINIVSKNALMAGPSNIAYGTAKAAQLHMSRLLAAELGKDKIRVNVVNPDAVLRGSKIWENGWAEGRANAYGIKPEELPAYYASRTLLNEEILPEDIANAVFVFVSGALSKSTGNILNVDGGIAAAFPR